MTPPPDRSRRERPTARTPQRSARPPRRKPLDPARRAAFDVLQAVRERDAYPNLLLPVLLRERGISGRDAAFATELTYGSSRVRGLLDAVIGSAANREPETINPILLDLLRLGTYQLLRTRVDAHAAVSTTVEQAGIEFDSSRAGFVNAVLRTISTRDEQSWVDELAPDRSVDPVGHAAFVRAHPRWIAQSFVDALGASAGELDAALAADDDRPQVHLAARPGVLTAEELAGAVNGDVGRFSPYAVYLPSGDPAQISAVRDGQALVQDEGSQLVARALTLAPLADDHGRWLDLCAGPGGKTALLAALAAGSRSEGHRGRARRTPRRPGRPEHQRPAGRRAAGRRAQHRARAGFRPGAGRRAVHRSGCAAAPTRLAVATTARRRSGADSVATRIAGGCDRVDPARRRGFVCDLLAASGRDDRGSRRRVAPSSGDRA